MTQIGNKNSDLHATAANAKSRTATALVDIFLPEFPSTDSEGRFGANFIGSCGVRRLDWALGLVVMAPRTGSPQDCQI